MADAMRAKATRASLLVTLFVAIVMLAGGWFVANRLLSPSDSAAENIESANGFNSIPLTQPFDPASPLRAGDQLVAIDGRSLVSWLSQTANPTATHPQWRIGQRVVYTIQRDSRTHDITVTLEPFPLEQFLGAAGPYLLTVLLTELIAIYVFVRRFRDPAARLVFLTFSMWFDYTVCCTLGIAPLDYTTGVNMWLVVFWAAMAFPLTHVMQAHLALVFPRPLPLIQRRSWLPWLLYILPAISFLSAGVMVAAPPGLQEVCGNIFGAANTVAIVVGTIVFSVAVVTQIWTQRDTLARQQWRLVMVPIALTLAATTIRPWLGPLLGVPGLFATDLRLGNGGHGDVLTLFSLLIPLGLTVAILRYRLWDFDVLVNRSVVYGLLSLLLLGVYGAIVVGLGALAQTLASAPALTVTARALIATGVVAILFQPLRSRLQVGINHLFYGWRDEPYQALAQLGKRLATTLAPDAVLPVIAETVGQALRVPYVAIAVESQGAADGHAATLAPAAAYGTPTRATDTALRLPLSYQQMRVGELWLAPRSLDETFTAADTRLLADLTRQIGVAVHAVQLTYDLQKSRERLVLAREEERRRLRRDLHDGLGPTLAALALKASAVAELIPGAPAAASALASELTNDLRATIGEIRRLVYALRPPILDELGLLAALQDCARQYDERGDAPMMRLNLPTALPSLPAAVEVAVLRITQEALTNVMRHAHAQTCEVSLTRAEGALRLTIHDDGVGLAGEQNHIGVGLRSMRERAEELGGVCQIESTAGSGVCVAVTLPAEAARSAAAEDAQAVESRSQSR